MQTISPQLFTVGDRRGFVISNWHLMSAEEVVGAVAACIEDQKTPGVFAGGADPADVLELGWHSTISGPLLVCHRAAQTPVPAQFCTLITKEQAIATARALLLIAVTALEATAKGIQLCKKTA